MHQNYSRKICFLQVLLFLPHCSLEFSYSETSFSPEYYSVNWFFALLLLLIPSFPHPFSFPRELMSLDKTQRHCNIRQNLFVFVSLYDFICCAFYLLLLIFFVYVLFVQSINMKAATTFFSQRKEWH